MAIYPKLPVALWSPLVFLSMVEKQNMSRVTAYNVFRSYMSKKGFSMDQLSDIWAVAENKQLFKDLTKKLQGPGVAAKHIANAFSNRHGDNMFRDVGGGAGGTPPESKISPPDDLESWKDVLQKVGVSAALAATFRDVYSAGVNAVTAKAFQDAFSSPWASTSHGTAGPRPHPWRDDSPYSERRRTCEVLHLRFHVRMCGFEPQ
jgi:hypothetical protein